MSYLKIYDRVIFVMKRNPTSHLDVIVFSCTKWRKKWIKWSHFLRLKTP